MIHSKQHPGCRAQGPGTRGYRGWKIADFSHSAGTAHGAPPQSAPPCVTFSRVVAPLRGPGQSPVLPFACCVGSLRSVGRCGRCSCWCRFRVRGAQSLVCWGCAGCGMVCRLRVSPRAAPLPLQHSPCGDHPRPATIGDHLSPPPVFGALVGPAVERRGPRKWATAVRVALHRQDLDNPQPPTPDTGGGPSDSTARGQRPRPRMH